MAGKLKSILTQTPWFLARNALVFALAWLFLPFWLFCFVALALYFFPFFCPFRLWLPFFLILFFAYIISPNGWAAVFLGVLFALLLGIKRLRIVGRFHAHQILIYLISFLLFLNFFSRTPALAGWGVFVSSAVTGAAYFFLFLRLFQQSSGSTSRLENRKKTLVVGLVSLLLWQAMLTFMFLPMRFFSQAALLFLFAITATEIAVIYLDNALSRKKLLAEFSIFFALAVFILALNQWKL